MSQCCNVPMMRNMGFLSEKHSKSLRQHSWPAWIKLIAISCKKRRDCSVKNCSGVPTSIQAHGTPCRIQARRFRRRVECSKISRNVIALSSPFNSASDLWRDLCSESFYLIGSWYKALSEPTQQTSSKGLLKAVTQIKSKICSTVGRK